MAENYPQTLQNHTKQDPPFHFFASPILLLNVLWCGYGVYRNPGLDSAWALVVSLALAVTLVLTRVYALRVQDRLIRLEERLRMKELLAAPLLEDSVELTEKQLVALRFAADAELPALVKATLLEKLSPADIKKRINNWRGDYFRV